jgi:hypothetical protein
VVAWQFSIQKAGVRFPLSVGFFSPFLGRKTAAVFSIEGDDP